MARLFWRILMGSLCLFLLLFAAVQYNDPDPEIWVPLYTLGAIWTGLAAFAPRLLWARPASWLLLISVVAAAMGVAYYWPDHVQWWRQEVWWVDEGSREGMGVMILATCVALVGGYRLISRRV
jgi:peptidoglycan/LPS O-acetylase OafA/YrhL